MLNSAVRPSIDSFTKGLENTGANLPNGYFRSSWIDLNHKFESSLTTIVDDCVSEIERSDITKLGQLLTRLDFINQYPKRDNGFETLR